MILPTFFMVKNGCCSFLEANWSGTSILAEMLRNLPDALADYQLCDLFVEGQWRRDLLLDIVYDFVSTFTFHFTVSPDTLVWKPDSQLIILCAWFIMLCLRCPRYGHEEF